MGFLICRLPKKISGINLKILLAGVELTFNPFLMVAKDDRQAGMIL